MPGKGNDEAAITALRQRVLSDGPRALDHYAPFVAWQRQLADAPAPPPWTGTIRLYSQWMSRFPDRAENYVMLALIADEQPDAPTIATSLLQSGREQGAEPGQLLSFYLEQRPAR